MEIAEIFNYLEKFTKGMGIVAAAITAVVAIMPKVSRYFSDIAAKNRLKRDLELLKLAEETSVEIKLIQERINESIKSLYREKKKIRLPSFPGILAGFFWGGAFSWWTYEIYTDSGGFSPWMILTVFFGLLGISAMTSSSSSPKNEKTKRPVFAIYVFSWWSVFGNLIVFIGCAWGAITLFIASGTTFWHVLIMTGICGTAYGFCTQFVLRRRKYFQRKNPILTEKVAATVSDK